MALTFIKTTVTSVVFTVAGSCYAQLGGVVPLPQVKKVEGPTLEETVRWITEKMPTAPMGTCDTSEASDPKNCSWQARFDGCDVTLIHTWFKKWGPSYGNADLYHVERFPLVDVELKVMAQPLSRGEVAYELQFRGLGNKDVIKRGGTKLTVSPATLEMKLSWLNSGPFLYTDVGSRMYFGSSEIADRLATAFRHAQGLCRQRAAEDNAKRLQDDAAKNAKKPGELF